jgi:hypothetical protein
MGARAQRGGHGRPARIHLWIQRSPARKGGLRPILHKLWSRAQRPHLGHAETEGIGMASPINSENRRGSRVGLALAPGGPLERREPKWGTRGGSDPGASLPEQDVHWRQREDPGRSRPGNRE